MAQYKVQVKITEYAWWLVEADSEKEAKEIVDSDIRMVKLGIVQNHKVVNPPEEETTGVVAFAGE